MPGSALRCAIDWLAMMMRARSRTAVSWSSRARLRWTAARACDACRSARAARPSKSDARRSLHWTPSPIGTATEQASTIPAASASGEDDVASRAPSTASSASAAGT
jgi:hypothetical protein